MESYALYGVSMVKLVWRLSGGLNGENMVNQSTRQFPYQFYHKISIENTTLLTVAILST